MSNLFGMIWTGVSGVNAAQIGISVTGNNMSNMKTENYSRQTVELVTKKPQYTYNGAIGKGVDVAAVRREYDDLLAANVRNSNSNYLYYNSMSTTLKSAMLYFNELESGSGLGDALKNYFNAWQDLSNSARGLLRRKGHPDQPGEGPRPRQAGPGHGLSGRPGGQRVRPGILRPDPLRRRDMEGPPPRRSAHGGREGGDRPALFLHRGLHH